MSNASRPGNSSVKTARARAMTGTGHTTWALTAVMLASTKDVPKVRCQCSVDDWLAQNLEALLNLEAIS